MVKSTTFFSRFCKIDCERVIATNTKAVQKLATEFIEEALKQGKEITLFTRGRSMLPLLARGDRITVVHCDWKKLRCGDIIFYKTSDTGDRFIAHRFMRKIKHVQSCLLLTKGDAHLHYDRPLPPEALFGKIIRIQKNSHSFSLCHGVGKAVNTILFLLSLTRISSFAFTVLFKIKHILILLARIKRPS